ncbi:Retrovirus-related Pol poly from transposon [Labeo rohita]|nr:Retrovirus-related Pol poly from transposon [Labeo rohita]
MIIHQGLLYRRIKSEDGRHRLQLIPPKALIQRTLQSLHSRTAERHHGRLRTLLRILEVAWWPAVYVSHKRHILPPYLLQ